MKFTESHFPIGATWELRKHGKIYYITLEKRLEYFEVWYYGSSYDDGSGHQFEWAKSYRSAREKHWVDGRFKRIK